MREWREKAELCGKVRQALDEQPTLDDFKQAIGRETDYVFELRGANPTLDGDLFGLCDFRLYRMGLRRPFWMKLVTVWTPDFAALADEQGADAVPHLWRGLMGTRLVPEQRPVVRQLVKQLGVVGTAQALCQVVAAGPENTPADDVFQRFGERCRKAIEERMKKGLPPPVVKRPLRRPRIDLTRLDLLPKALGIDGDQCPHTQGERGPRDHVKRRRRRPAQPRARPTPVHTLPGNLGLADDDANVIDATRLFPPDP